MKLSLYSFFFFFFLPTNMYNSFLFFSFYKNQQAMWFALYCLIASAEQHEVLGIMVTSSTLSYTRNDGIFGRLFERSAKRLGTHRGSTLIDFLLFILAVHGHQRIELDVNQKVHFHSLYRRKKKPPCFTHTRMVTYVRALLSLMSSSHSVRSHQGIRMSFLLFKLGTKSSHLSTRTMEASRSAKARSNISF